MVVMGYGRQRPPALMLGRSIANFLNDAAPWPPHRIDIPVRGTFIDFGGLTGTPPDSPQLTVSTAPARIGSSLRDTFDTCAMIVTPSSTSSSSAKCALPVATPPSSSDSSTRVTTSSLLSFFEQGADNESHLRRNSLPASAELDEEGQRARGPGLRSDRAHFGEEPTAGLSGRAAGADADEAEATDDEGSSDDDQGLCPVYSEGAALPSAGSALHSEGTCKRCCFFPKGRCSNGNDCQFCHFAHEKRASKSKKKKKRRSRKQRQGTAQSSSNAGCAQISSSVGCAPSPQSRLPHAPSVQEVLGSSSLWAPPQQQPSKLIVHGLHFVPPRVMPGNPVTMQLLQITPQMWPGV